MLKTLIVRLKVKLLEPTRNPSIKGHPQIRSIITSNKCLPIITHRAKEFKLPLIHQTQNFIDHHPLVTRQSSPIEQHLIHIPFS